MPYVLKIEPEAREDIQEAVDWYNEQLSGLGKEFHATVKAYLNDLRSNPFFQIRYEGVRCLPMNKFPYMIHGVINTFLHSFKRPLGRTSTTQFSFIQHRQADALR